MMKGVVPAEILMIVSKSLTNHDLLKDAFSLGEANVALEGFDPQRHPLYAMLKAQVLSREMTASEMGDEIIAYVMCRQTNNAAS
jgi:hypothetical protein